MATFADLAEASLTQACELVQGELVLLTPSGGVHGFLESQVAMLLGEAERAGLGVSFSGDVGIIVDGDTVRGADNAFALTAQLPLKTSPEGYLLTVPALTVEILSPNDRASAVFQKVCEYLTAGARVVWTVGYPNRAVTLYEAGPRATILRGEDRLVAPGVLDSLATTVNSLFAKLPF